MTAWPDLPLRVPVTIMVAALGAAGLGLLAGVNPKLALGAAVAAAFLAISLADLTIGVCLLTALVILDARGALGVAKPAGAVMAVSWLATLATRDPSRRTFASQHPRLSYALLVFLAWVGLSAVWAESSSVAIAEFVRMAPIALLLPITYDALQERRHAVWLLSTFAAAAALAAVFGMISPPPDPNSADAGRVGSTFGDANEFASALVAGLPLAGALALGRLHRPLLRLLFGLAAGACLLALFLTLSRGGLIALVAATVAAVVFAGRWRRRALAVASLVAVAVVSYFALFAALPARERVTNIGGGTGRLDLWTVGGRMVAANELRGVGAGNFPVASVHYLLRPGIIQRADFIVSTPKVAHNTYLQAAAELGIPAAALFLGVVLFCLRCAVLAARQFARRGDEPMEILARGLIVGLIAYLAAIMFISEIDSKLLWMLLALGPALYAISRGRPREAPLRRARGRRALAGPAPAT